MTKSTPSTVTTTTNTREQPHRLGTMSGWDTCIDVPPFYDVSGNQSFDFLLFQFLED